MSSETKTQKPSIFKSFTTAVIAIAVIAVIMAGLGAVGLPTWPYIFFLYYFTTIANMAKEKLWIAAIGGVIGLSVSFSQGIITLFTRSETTGFIVFLVLVILLVTFLLEGRWKVIDPFCLLLLTCLTNFAGVTQPVAYLPALASLALSVLTFAIIIAITERSAAKKTEAVPGKEMP